jgi:hypothetical protein
MSTYVEISDLSLNIVFLSISRRWGAIRTGLNFAFDFYLEGKSSTSNISITSQKILELSNFDVKINYMGNDNQELYLGKLIAKKPTISLKSNTKTKIVFKLDLTFAELKKLEALKESTNIRFLTDFIFSSETEIDSEIKTIHKARLEFNVSKSNWVEALHSRLRYANRPVFTST